MRAGLFGVVLLAAACGSAAQAPRAMPDWLSGYWLSCEAGRETAESWIGAGKDVMVGTNLSADGFEFLRIAPASAGEGVSSYSMPNGRSPPTEFVLRSNDGARAVFENPAHDFPQRVVYAREGDVLTARIESLDGNESMEWRFERRPLDTRCPA